MGDLFQNLAIPDIAPADIDRNAEAVLRFLTDREIVSPDRTDCTLGSEFGYPPGPNYANACKHPFHEDFRFHDLLTNGLELATQRNVYHFGQDQLRLACTACNTSLTKIPEVPTEFIEKIDDWYQSGHAPDFKCPICSTKKSMTEWQRGANIIVSDFALVFWNWPPLKPQFIDDIHQLVRAPVYYFSGKL